MISSSGTAPITCVISVSGVACDVFGRAKIMLAHMLTQPKISKSTKETFAIRRLPAEGVGVSLFVRG